MNCIFIAGIEALLVTENLGRGDLFGGLFRITNDKDFISGLLPRCFTEVAGTLETQYLLSGEPVVYASEEFSPSNSAEALRHLTLRLRQVEHFLHILWYEKDNAAHIERGYLVTGLDQAFPSVHRNSFCGPRTTALGQFCPTRFSREELRRARAHSDEVTTSETDESAQILGESLGRWGRADYFVQAARAAGDLGVKIANYCTALEALFSSDSQELSHKLAERIAVFLETDSANRYDLYQIMKGVYKIRSKVVHGARGDANLFDQSRRVSTTCDDICRRALLKILAEGDLHNFFLEEEKDKNLDEFFLKRIFGGEATAKREGREQ